MKTKIAVRMNRTKKPDGEEAFTASVPIKIIFDESFNADTLQRELKLLEQEYKNVIASMREIIQQIKSKGILNKVLLYWMLGDKIYSYEIVNGRRELTLEGVTKHLARDLGISRNMVRRCR